MESPLEDDVFVPKSKKTKLSLDKSEKKTYKRDLVHSTPAMTLEEVDFPHGGGTALTPLEVNLVKTIRAEAIREADQELCTFTEQAQAKPKQRRSDTKGKAIEVDGALHFEHLNYKRLVPGMRVLCAMLGDSPQPRSHADAGVTSELSY